jgi:predicted RNA-binding Zn ribbon-like protein
MTVGVTARPGELVRDFVNTLDVDTGQDELTSPAALAAWLREHGLETTLSATEDDLRDAVALRESLRAALRGNHAGAERSAPAGLDELMADYPLQLSLRTGTPELQPAGRGAHAGLGRIVAAVAASHADRSWSRLKVCAESTCQWAFLDTSRNQSRSWCSMSVCGNRAKTKAYRTRHKQPSAGGAQSRASASGPAGRAGQPGNQPGQE